VSFLGRADLDNPEVRRVLTDRDNLVFIVTRAGTRSWLSILRIAVLTAVSVVSFRARGGPAN
jgi:hypothetical protein